MIDYKCIKKYVKQPFERYEYENKKVVKPNNQQLIELNKSKKMY